MKNYRDQLDSLLGVVESIDKFSLSGNDLENGVSIEIEDGHMVEIGKEIEFYDKSVNDFIVGEVESIRMFDVPDRGEFEFEIEVFDYTSNTSRIFELQLFK